MIENPTKVECDMHLEDEKSENEERALSVFASEKNEDLTALVLVVVVTFFVLLFTKWLA
ncbi:hypothetical protein [Maridesulfovibrio hydrothermalis]|uniref:Uncharacterized protein n=1 Tax=Maridesulfovibrio hydrothermalis AM13 = DSM 14728 TaxID=1121451 RepID=L0RBI1_9BACT|nr:hypothetical protein [Maridesulfovibrio hydrothermalis]CCO24119.1 protein of unknown function [Maridesulfovibrio hydrothermalis AM13 = DSM 14728]